MPQHLTQDSKLSYEECVIKENGDHDLEDVKVDIAIVDGGVVNNHNHAFEDVKTLGVPLNSCEVTKCSKRARKISTDVPDILSDIVETEFPTQRKDEQDVIGNYEETRILKLVTYDEENVLDIVFIIQKMADNKKDVGDIMESSVNKAKEDGFVRNNIVIVEPFGGTLGTKKIMITNLNPEKIRKIEVIVVELMESSDSSDSESDDDNLNWLLN
ncbi:unnamed protein product [Vicia faba]|uniref:Uncharacterized protein n=1 Tax=Vicia faba TaxID=3906 RepID=A0AAV1BCE6_VICFA|nr:unnamed protein product [Vicia faba]